MLSDYTADELLDWLKGNAVATPPSALYLSLHSANPGPAGTSSDITTTLAGARVEVPQEDLGALADRAEGGRQTSSEEVITFTSSALASGSITHVGLWDASSGGNFLAGDALEAVVNVLPGDIIRIPIGQFQLIAVGFPDP